MSETTTANQGSKGAESNLSRSLPKIIDAMERTPYGEVKVILKNGRVVEIVETRKTLL